MTISDVRICNLALAEIGARPIASLSENSQNARSCSTFYETSRDAVLSGEFSWNFALFNLELASVTVPDGFGEWAYAYGYPSDCLRARSVHDGAGTEANFEVGVYSGVGNQKLKAILTNLENAYLRLTVRITDPQLFDAQFVEAFHLHLASKLAWSLFKKTSLEQTLYQKYLLAIPQAQAADADEKTEDTDVDDPWVLARW